VSSQRVIRTYLAIAGLYTLAASLIWGVNTLFLLDAGLSVFEVFVANAGYTAGMVLFEIPTGVVADTSGRRVSFLASLAVLFTGTLTYLGLASVEAGVVAFTIASVFLGLGFTFYTGAVDAWVVDALSETGFAGPLDQVFARGGIVTGIAMLVGTIGGGILGDFDLGYPYVVRAALLGMVFVIALFGMRDIGFTPRRVSAREYPAETLTVAKAGFATSWGDRSVRLIMFLSLVHVGIFVWVFYAWPPYFLDLLGSDAVWVAGVIAGLIGLSMTAGNTIADLLTRTAAKRTTIMAGAVAVQAIAAAIVGLAGSFWVAAPALLVATSTFGVLTPVKSSYLNQRITSEERATVISIDSLSGSLGAVGSQVGLGKIADVWSFSTGFIVAGISALLALVPVSLLRARGDAADVIATEAAHRRTAPVPPSGLPTEQRWPGRDR
jgi:MFS family permease